MVKSAVRNRKTPSPQASPESEDVDQKKPQAKSEEPSQHWCVRWFWFAVNVLKWPVVLMIVIPLLNYVTLKSEHALLLPDDALLYDIGQGQKLMLRCAGSGAPTVILEASAGKSSDMWSDVRTRLSNITRVCVYDRAGIGFSERPLPAAGYSPDPDAPPAKPYHRSQEFTVERMADDLKRLLTESSSQPLPFILVGMELGALVSRFYSHMFDSQTSHVVLIDPLSSELFSSRVWLEHWRTDILYKTQAQQMAGAMGINRLALITGLSEVPDFWSQMSDVNVTARQMHLSCHPKHLKSAVDELAGVLDSLQQIKTLSTVKPLPKPLRYTVLYRSQYDVNGSEELNVLWKDAYSGLATSLHLPADQMNIIQTSSRSAHESLSGETILKLTELVRSKVREYRKGKVKTA